MTRIIAGSARGRRLQVPAGDRTRPTSDRAREGLFSSLQSLLDLEGARVLDLFAGTGALGLEALSRGAASAVLVERDAVVLRALQANATGLGLDGATVVHADVRDHLRHAPAGEFDLVLLDPPYVEDVDDVLAALAPHLAEEAVVVLERAARGSAPTWPQGLLPERERRYGEAVLRYARWARLRSGA